MSENRRIAKNTILLYIRLVIATLVGLYTTRVVLKVLGVENYGIYSVVGSIMSMLSFLKSSMSTSTSRFLSYEIGLKNNERLRLIFSTSMMIHLFFALFVVLFGETIGMWFLENKLNIPDGRMEAAKFVLHCSVISTALTITQVPYNSVLIAHEKMGVYAYVEVLNVTLKLLIVYVLSILDFDKLKLYAFLYLAVTLLVSLVYRIFCIRSFEETKLSFIWNQVMMKQIMHFSIWQMFSSLCMSMKQQGQNFIVNIYRGVTLNAALGISDMMYGTLTSLSYNMLSAFNPPIIKAYAEKKYFRMSQLISNASQFSFLMLAFISIPVIVNMQYILTLWLGTIPAYVPEITVIALVFNCFGTFNSVLTTSINATGQNKTRSIITGCSMLLGLLVLYLSFLFDFPIIYSFISFYIGIPIMIIGSLIDAKQKMPFLEIKKILFVGLFRPLMGSVIIFFLVNYIKLLFTSCFLQLLFTSIFSMLLFVIYVYFVCLDSSQRNVIQLKVNSCLKWKL